MDAGLTEKVALVTGASGGLGAEIARALARERARVVIHFHRGRDAAKRLAEEIGPSRCAVVGADLTKEDDVAALWREAERRLGPVEIAVANAGIWPADAVGVHAMSLAQWERTISTDLTAVFLSMRAFFQGIERRRLEDPAAVLVGSTAGVFGEAGHADYAAAKSGVIYGLLLSLKNEIARLAPLGRVNAVCPGWTVTPMTEQLANQPELVQRVLQTIPLRKLGRPPDVASAVVFLASNRLAGHITGQMLVAGGGMEGRVLYDPREIDPSRA